jgi:hypothetical protein
VLHSIGIVRKDPFNQSSDLYQKDDLI